MNKKLKLKTKIINFLILNLRMRDSFSPKGFPKRLQKTAIENKEEEQIPKKFAKYFTEQYIENIKCFKITTDNTDRIDVVFFPGGAFNKKIQNSHWKFLISIANLAKCNILICTYPRLPEYNHTQCYNAITKVYKAINVKYGNKFILMGDSAGAGLCAGLTAKCIQEGLPKPKGLILLCPWVDLVMDDPRGKLLEDNDVLLRVYGLKELAKMWANDKPLDYYLVSPTYANLTSFPKTHIFTGDKEVLHYDILNFYDKLKSQGVDADITIQHGLSHDYMLLPVPDAKPTIEKIANQINSFK